MHKKEGKDIKYLIKTFRQYISWQRVNLNMLNTTFERKEGSDCSLLNDTEDLVEFEDVKINSICDPIWKDLQNSQNGREKYSFPLTSNTCVRSANFSINDCKLFHANWINKNSLKSQTFIAAYVIFCMDINRNNQ